MDGVTGADYSGEALVANLGDDRIWGRPRDADNGYMVRADFTGGKVKLIKYRYDGNSRSAVRQRSVQRP